MLSIKNFCISGPDDDGDMRAEGSYDYTNNSHELHELIISNSHVLTENGLLVSSSADEHEEHVDVGENIELNVNSGYFKNITTSNSLQLLLNTVGCRCIYKDIGQFEILQGCISGDADPFDLGQGYWVQGISVNLGEPDTDNESMLEIKVLIRNTSSFYTPKIKIEGSVIGQNGRELDECSTYGESMMPGENRLLIASAYYKTSRLRNSKVSVRICLFVPSNVEQAKASIAIN